MTFRIPDWKIKRAVRLRREGRSWRTIARLSELSTRTLLAIFRAHALIGKAQTGNPESIAPTQGTTAHDHANT